MQNIARYNSLTDDELERECYAGNADANAALISRSITRGFHPEYELTTLLALQEENKFLKGRVEELEEERDLMETERDQALGRLDKLVESVQSAIDT